MATDRSRINRNNRERGKDFERKMADLLGFFRVPYSGAAAGYGEGDLRDAEDREKSLFLGECKTITPRSQREINYVLKRDWLVGDKGIVARAKESGGKFPFLAFTRARSPLAFVVLRAEDFKLVVDLLRVLERDGVIPKYTNVEALREWVAWALEGGDDDEA